MADKESSSTAAPGGGEKDKEAAKNAPFKVVEDDGKSAGKEGTANPSPTSSSATAAKPTAAPAVSSSSAGATANTSNAAFKPFAVTSTSAAGPRSVAPNLTATAATVTSSSNLYGSNKRPPSAQKKRPYRRTKRPKNYCDKSTVTTTTDAVNTPVNVYDAVLGEAEDLLLAATEAQALGRLKMASAYQLLLHARLVGLGKRFDRAVMAEHSSSRNGRRRKRRRSSAGGAASGDRDNEAEYDEEYTDDEEFDSADEEGDVTTDAKIAATIPPASAQAVIASAPKTSAAAGGPPTAAASTGTVETASGVVANLPTALQALTSILPSNIEMDVTMMEHLARAAVELHHQRTGRKKSAEGLLASPINGFIGTPDQTNNNANNDKKDGATAGTSTAGATGTAGGRNDNKNSNNKIAWTDEEQDIVAKALEKNEKITPNALSKLLKNKTEAQVKAYLKNQRDRAKNQDEVDEEITPRKRGGRGRKPPTTAMNTVPNANLDARSLLQGKILNMGKGAASPSPGAGAGKPPASSTLSSTLATN